MVIEAMADVIRQSKREIWDSMKTAQALLNLRYDCEECNGTKEKIEGCFSFHVRSTCPKCKDDKGSRMLAILNPDGSIKEDNDATE